MLSLQLMAETKHGSPGRLAMLHAKAAEDAASASAAAGLTEDPYGTG